MDKPKGGRDSMYQGRRFLMLFHDAGLQGAGTRGGRAGPARRKQRQSKIFRRDITIYLVLFQTEKNHPF